MAPFDGLSTENSAETGEKRGEEGGGRGKGEEDRASRRPLYLCVGCVGCASCERRPDRKSWLQRVGKAWMREDEGKPEETRRLCIRLPVVD